MKHAITLGGVWTSFLCVVVISIVGAKIPPVSGADNSGAKGGDGVAELIHHADTFYWVAMAERGSMSAIKRGIEYLDAAETLLPDSGLSLTQRQTFKEEILALRDDLENQANVHHNTHYGVFPLARFVASTLFTDPRASGSFELVDDPREIATREAVEDLIEHVVESQTVIPQFDVVFLSDPPSLGLENEALYQFNRSARFFVHNRRELAKVLDVSAAGVDDIWPSGQMDPSPDVVSKMVDSWKNAGVFRSSHLLLVRIRRIDEYHGDYFYIAEGRICAAAPDAEVGASPVLNQYGFCIDRRNMLAPILALHGVLLLVSLCLYPILVKLTSHAGRVPTWQNTFIFGGLGFLWGRGVIWALAPVLAGMEPEPETLAIWSFWWPSAAGLIFTLGPATILGFADRRFNWFGSAFATFNRGGALFASITLGSAAYLGQCVLVYKGAGGWPLIPPLLLTTVLAAFTVGRAFDKTDATPLAAGVIAAVLTLFLGAAWCSASAIWLWLMLVPFGAILAVAIRRVARPVTVTRQTAVTPIQETAAEGTPTNSIELAERAYDPPYYPSVSYRKLHEALKPWLGGATVKIGLKGPAGVGKTAALEALTAEAREHYPGLIVLKGVCDQPQDGNKTRPYEPFTEAIAEHFEVNLLAPQGDQMGQIDDALGGIFDRVVPFADILFPPHAQSLTGSKSELFTAIAAMLGRLTSQHPVMLILDDVHWMDEASRDLLQFLLAEFRDSTTRPLAILLASRTELKFTEGFDQSTVLTVEPLSKENLQSIMVEGMGLELSLATEIIGAAGQHRDNLHWLFQIVAHLSQQDLLMLRDEGFSWKDPAARISAHMPASIRQSLEESIAGNREFRSVLECAACVGQEFSVNMVSKVVGLPRLELIHLLDRIEEQTGIVIDLRDKDDHFAFRSSFLLEVLRDSREVHAGGPRDGAMPQRVREYHYRLASALEETLDDSNAALYEVANHYFAAGARHADKAVEYSVRAAKAACFQFQHNLARKYLAMAEDCTSFTRHRNVDFERELQLISCHQAHVEGTRRVRTAEQVWDYLKRFPDSDFEVYRTAARASYDAGIDTRDQKHFADCVDIAREMLDRFSALTEQAEAYHFFGIGLPISHRDERCQRLRTALQLADKACQADEKNLEAFRLKSRVAASLAEQLSFGSLTERSESRELFELSIDIKHRADIRDLEGLASAYGGLGRLAFFADPPDYEQARENFEHDLKYSERIGSLIGQSKMHSFLGACVLGMKESEAPFEAALAHYEAARAAALERVDVLFALAGLLECHGAMGHTDDIELLGNELFELIRHRVEEMLEKDRDAAPVSAIPEMCRGQIAAALRTCQPFTASQWHQWLTGILDSNRK